MKANRLFITLLLILTFPGFAANAFTTEDKPRVIVLGCFERSSILLRERRRLPLLIFGGFGPYGDEKSTKPG